MPRTDLPPWFVSRGAHPASSPQYTRGLATTRCHRMAPGEKHSKSYSQSREITIVHISTAITALPGVLVRSKRGRFERNGPLQGPNRWQNRVLRTILPLEPTGLGGPPSQPTALPANPHGVVAGAAGRRPYASSTRSWLGNGPPLSKKALLASDWPTKDPSRSIFGVDHESGIYFDVKPTGKHEKAIYFPPPLPAEGEFSRPQTKHQAAFEVPKYATRALSWSP